MLDGPEWFAVLKSSEPVAQQLRLFVLDKTHGSVQAGGMGMRYMHREGGGRLTEPFMASGYDYDPASVHLAPIPFVHVLACCVFHPYRV